MGRFGEGHHAIADAAAKAARFDGEAGAIVELFVADDGQAKQLLLVGVGSGDEAGWSKAGGALVARLLTSGATELVADLSDADVTRRPPRVSPPPPPSAHGATIIIAPS